MSDGVAVAWSLSVASTASAFSKRLWESWRRLVAGAISKVLWEGCGKVPEHFSKRSGSPSIGPSDAAAYTCLARILGNLNRRLTQGVSQRGLKRTGAPPNREGRPKTASRSASYRPLSSCSIPAGFFIPSR